MMLAAGALVAALPLLAQGPLSWDRFAERHDTDGDGAVTRDELAPTSPLFDHLDADGDGVVTADDLEERHAGAFLGMLARRADGDGDGVLTAAELDAWFTARDTDGDGRVDGDDLAAGPRGRRGHRPGALFGPAGDGFGRDDLAALVARYDADGDGSLSAAELPEAPAFHGGRHHGFAGRAHGLAAADADGDGAVSRAEFDAMVARHPYADPEHAAARFAALDADGDGVIGRDELPGRGEGRGPRRGPRR
jgi:Ca2+-binding EF-hand superfamily protein